MWFTKVFVVCFVFCGNLGLLKALPSPNLEIAGGSPVSASEAHYVVRISSSTGGCTGQLISPNYVLTAGHCVHNVATATIYLGYQKTADMLRATTRQAIDIKVHENYTPYPDTSNDLALLRLNQSVAETNRISIVKFPGKNEGVINYTDLVAYGWGRVADNQVTDVLRTAALKVTPCYNPKDKTVICTSRQQGKSVCKGDSGGPLVRPGDVLVGVTSSGECGYDPVYLSIFTRVDYYLDWIEKNSDAVIPN